MTGDHSRLFLTLDGLVQSRIIWWNSGHLERSGGFWTLVGDQEPSQRSIWIWQEETGLVGRVNIRSRHGSASPNTGDWGANGVSQ